MPTIVQNATDGLKRLAVTLGATFAKTDPRRIYAN